MEEHRRVLSLLAAAILSSAVCIIVPCLTVSPDSTEKKLRTQAVCLSTIPHLHMMGYGGFTKSPHLYTNVDNKMLQQAFFKNALKNPSSWFIWHFEIKSKMLTQSISSLSCFQIPNILNYFPYIPPNPGFIPNKWNPREEAWELFWMMTMTGRGRVKKIGKGLPIPTSSP